MVVLYILLSLLLAAAIAYLFMMSPRLPGKAMAGFLQKQTYFAHRGLHDDVDPENSLPAFRKAVEAGFGIELDVQITKDGIPVVFHDDTLKRGCGVDAGIYDYTLAELQTLPLFGRADLSVPTLADVLQTVGGKVPLIVEIKAGLPEWRETVREAMKLLSAYEGDYCVESFNPVTLSLLRKEYPSVIRGQLCEHYGKEFKAQGKKMPLSYAMAQLFCTNLIARPDFVAYNCQHAYFFPYRLLCRLFPKCAYIAWTTRTPEHEKLSRFDAYIFENYIPNTNGESTAE